MIADYTELKLEVADWSHRPDLDIKMDIFSVMAETMIDKDLRVREMEKREPILIDATYIDFPDDYLETRSFDVASKGGRVTMRYVTPAQADTNYSKSSGGPFAFSVHGNQMQIIPGLDNNVGSPIITYNGELSYYARVLPIATSGSPQTNIILTTYPMVYLSSMLIQVYMYLQDAEEQMRWEQQYQNAVASANKTSQGGRYLTPSVNIY